VTGRSERLTKKKRNLIKRNDNDAQAENLPAISPRNVDSVPLESNDNEQSDSGYNKAVKSKGERFYYRQSKFGDWKSHSPQRLLANDY
jgi:hypothetical protein